MNRITFKLLLKDFLINNSFSKNLFPLIMGVDLYEHGLKLKDIVFDIEDDKVADLINATTPVRRATGHLKLIAAFKFIATLGISDFKPRDQIARIPDDHKKFEEEIQKFLPDIMDGKLQIDPYVQKIS